MQVQCAISQLAILVTQLSRLQLAALHFNENSNRKQTVTKQGEEQYEIIFPKFKKGGYTVKKVPTYGMIERITNNHVIMVYCFWSTVFAFTGYIGGLVKETAALRQCGVPLLL